MKKHRISKLYIGAFLYKFTFLFLAFPIEALILHTAAPESAYPLYTVTAVLLAPLILWSVLLYKKAMFSESRNCFLSARGLFLTRNTVIRKDCVHIRSCTQKIPYLLFKAAELNLVVSHFQSSVFLSRKSAENLTDTTDAEESKAPHTEKVLSASGFFGTLVTCAGFSNTLTGLLTLIPLLRNAAKLIGQDSPLDLLTPIPLEDFFIFRLLPSSLRLLASLLVTFWLWGLVAAILKLWGFRLCKSGEMLTLRHGLLTRKRFVFQIHKISALSLRQNVLPLLLNLYTCVAYIPSEKGQKALPLSLAKFRQHQEELLCRLGFLPRKLIFSTTPQQNSLWGYLYLPYIYLFLVSALCIFQSLLPLYQLLSPLLVPLVLLGVGWVMFRFAGFLRSELSLYDNMLCISGFKGFSMEKCYLPTEYIRGIVIRESLFQRLRGRCTLVIYVKAASRLSFSIRHIDKKKAAQFLSCAVFVIPCIRLYPIYGIGVPHTIYQEFQSERHVPCRL